MKKDIVDVIYEKRKVSIMQFTIQNFFAPEPTVQTKVLQFWGVLVVTTPWPGHGSFTCLSRWHQIIVQLTSVYHALHLPPGKHRSTLDSQWVHETRMPELGVTYHLETTRK